MRRPAFLLAVLLAAASAAQASNLERFREYLRTTQSTRAEFAQKVYNREGALVQESKGQFVLLRPGRFRWTYEAPYPQLIVGDGAKVWIYDEDLNQVTVRKMEKAVGSTPAALLAGSTEIENAFEFSEGGREQGLDWLNAKPRQPEAGFERIRLGLGPLGVEAMELVDHFGQTTKLRFTHLTRNPGLDPATFRFTPPKGADVLGEE
jgi:outer membrane lipoprotein carrier protein